MVLAIEMQSLLPLLVLYLTLTCFELLLRSELVHRCVNHKSAAAVSVWMNRAHTRSHAFIAWVIIIPDIWPSMTLSNEHFVKFALVRSTSLLSIEETASVLRALQSSPVPEGKTFVGIALV